MSNRLYLIRTKFTDLVDNNETFGWRIFDSYEHLYSNHLDNADQLFPGKDLELLKVVIAALSEYPNFDPTGMVDFIKLSGIDIDGTWYDANQLKKLFELKEPV
jgi:hypothetical protein